MHCHRNPAPETSDSAVSGAIGSDDSSEETDDAVAPVGGPSFDCAQAKSSVETLICRSPELSDLDARLAELYKRHLASFGPDQEIALERAKLTQRQWFTEREQCASSECVKQKYRERIYALRNLGA